MKAFICFVLTAFVFGCTPAQKCTLYGDCTEINKEREEEARQQEEQRQAFMKKQAEEEKRAEEKEESFVALAKEQLFPTICKNVYGFEKGTADFAVCCANRLSFFKSRKYLTGTTYQDEYQTEVREAQEDLNTCNEFGVNDGVELQKCLYSLDRKRRLGIVSQWQSEKDRFPQTIHIE